MRERIPNGFALPQDYITVVYKHQWLWMIELECICGRLFILYCPFCGRNSFILDISHVRRNKSLLIYAKTSKMITKSYEERLPDRCSPSDKPPQPAKMSNVAKLFPGDASFCFSISKSVSPSLHFPFLFLDTASVSNPTEYLSLMWAGNYKQKVERIIILQFHPHPYRTHHANQREKKRNKR